MKRIGVIGSINMDMTVESERIPRPGETVSGKNLRYRPGGKGANQAVAAARLGGDVTMFGCVGQDDLGARLLENLKNQGVRTDAVAISENDPSGLAMIAVAESDNAILVVPGANQQVTPAYVESRRKEILDCDIILLQNEIPLETVLYAADLCHQAGKYILYDPAPAMAVPQKLLEQVSCLTPNEHEAAFLFPNAPALDPLLREYPQKLIVTLGGAGMAAALTDGEIFRLPGEKVPVVDTTGAGDTFNGAFAYALSAGKSFPDALRLANRAAAYSVQVPGAQDGMPTLVQLNL